ncbi:MAG: class I SAM-dependent methyltransferase [Vicinamibacteria bacterium]|nr:class I SAM-dependent methyltransferase [Vicinamibacteria bacterium]
MALLDQNPSEDGPLSKLKARQIEEDAAYEQALGALDRLVSFPLPAETLKDLPAQLETLNRLWQASAIQASGLVNRRVAEALQPVVSRQEEWNANVVRLLNGFIAEESKTLHHLREMSAALIHYAQRLLPTVDARDRLASGYATLRSELILEAFDRRLESLDRRIDGLKGLMDRVEIVGAEVRAVRATLQSQRPSPQLAAAASEAAESSAYVAFENKFRRSDDALVARFGKYAIDFATRPKDSTVLDLGCGRGEFLQAIGRAGITGRGVESNASAVSACQAAGLDVSHGDLIQFLKSTPSGSIGGVFAAQVAEHLPPSVLQTLLVEAFRVLKSGGLLILETVNPRSVTGLLEVFNRDLTHEKPLHPETLSFLASAAGFAEARVEMLSPVEPLSQLRRLEGTSALPGPVIETFNENVDRLNGLLYGSLEYALHARR